MLQSKPVNIQMRVSGRGGWIPAFMGESRGKSLERVLPELNDQGYRVAFVVDDRFNFFKIIINLLLAILTLGFYYQVPGLLIIGERIDGR